MSEEITPPELSGHITNVVDGDNKVHFQPVFIEVCALMDAVEMALNAGEHDRALELIVGRFEILEKHGFDVVFSALPVTGRRQ